jgi:hypothetical protein
MAQGDEVVILLRDDYCYDANRFLNEHRTYEERMAEHEAYRAEHSKRLEHQRVTDYLKPVEVTRDMVIEVAVFQNAEGDTLFLEDPKNEYTKSSTYYRKNNESDEDFVMRKLTGGTPHPTEEGFHCVSHINRVTQGKKKVTFPFFITKTKTYFTHDKSTTDLRDKPWGHNRSALKEYAPKCMEEEEDYPLEDYLYYRSDHGHQGTSWIHEQLSVSVKF